MQKQINITLGKCVGNVKHCANALDVISSIPHIHKVGIIIPVLHMRK